MPTEAQLRDLLANKLELIEPGLELVRTEFPLPNTAGTRGFIDILARDRYGHHVVIEIKRSKATAREALHELHKYTELLRAELRIAPENLRCVLISTDWTELARPVASFVRDTPYSVLGLLAKVNDDATEVQLYPMRRLDEPTSVRLTAVSEVLFYRAESDRDAAFEQLSPTLAAIGCPHHIGIRLNRELPFPGYRYALYLVLGSMTADAKAVRVLDYLIEDVPDDSIEAPQGAVWEYRALCHFGKDRPHEADSVEIGYPEKFRYLTSPDGRWTMAGAL